MRLSECGTAAAAAGRRAAAPYFYPDACPLFAPAVLPAPLATYDPATTLPDFAARVAALRQWQLLPALSWQY